MHVIVLSRARAIRTASDAVNTYCWTIKTVWFDPSKLNRAEEIQQTVFSTCCVTRTTMLFQIGGYRLMLKVPRSCLEIVRKRPVARSEAKSGCAPRGYQYDS